MAGYTRQDTTGQLANGNPIDADIFNDEYDAIEGAFNASTGHNHDGTTGGGAPIESIGPSQELEVTSSSVFPKVDNLIDSGKSTLQWRNGYFGTDVLVGQDVSVTRNVSIGGDLTVTGDATISGNLTFGDAATDTVDFQADIDSDLKPEAAGYNLGTSTQEWNNLWLDGTANVDTLTVDENATIAGTLGVTGATGIDGDFDINTNKFTIAAASGNTAIAGTLNVTGAITATGGVTGDLTGNVTGNLDGIIGGTTPAAATFTDITTSGNITVAGTVDGVDIAAQSSILTATTATADAALPKAGGTMTGDITFNSSQLFDGRDVSADGTKLDTIETNADVTDTANVTAAGAVMDSELTNETAVKAIDQGLATTDAVTFTTVTADVTGNIDGIVGGNTPAAGTFTTLQFNTSISDGTRTITGFVDEDDMVSNSSSLIPTQQSVKSYVDDAVAGDGTGDISASQVSVATGTGGVDLDGGSGTGWVIYQSGTDLKFKYNGVDKFSLSTAGALTVEDNVTAYGSA